MKFYLSLFTLIFVFSACTTATEPIADELEAEIKHSVPLNEILSGGPPKDGIPAIDDPKFTSVEEAQEFLNEDGLGVSVSFDGIDRFYPFQILVWHEIVNDRVGTQPALITYCPLCGSGIVFNPIVNGEVTEFGTSGKLWQSNLVMYDRQTDSYWSQILGAAIVGEMTGTELELLPYQNMRWSDWKNAFPNGEVLSRDTGHSRNYNDGPYGDYADNENIIFPVAKEDDRYHPKAPLFGIRDGETTKAYLIEDLQNLAKFTDSFAGQNLEISFDKDTQTIEIQNIDSGEAIIPFYSFWFSWVAAHPNSEVFTP